MPFPEEIDFFLKTKDKCYHFQSFSRQQSNFYRVLINYQPIFFSLNTMLIFMYIMCSIDFQDKSLNRLSPLDSIISPWPKPGRLSHSRKSLLSLYPSIYLSISSIIFLSGYFLVILSIYHTFIFQSSYFTYLFISSGNF